MNRFNSAQVIHRKFCLVTYRLTRKIPRHIGIQHECYLPNSSIASPLYFWASLDQKEFLAGSLLSIGSHLRASAGYQAGTGDGVRATILDSSCAFSSHPENCRYSQAAVPSLFVPPSDQESRLTSCSPWCTARRPGSACYSPRCPIRFQDRLTSVRQLLNVMLLHLFQ